MRDVQLVYILAASHSGSTLTAMLLNSHEDICTAGELKATNLGDAEAYRCSCRTLLMECPFWAAVSEKMAASGIGYDVCNAQTSLAGIPSAYVRRFLAPLHRGPFLELLRDIALRLSPTWRRMYPRWKQRNSALIRAISEVAEVPVVVDSSKIAIRLKYLSRIDGLKIRVVRLVRDGRAVALTYMKPTEFADASDPSLRGGGSGIVTHQQLTMTEAATEWRRSNEEAAEVLATIPAENQMRISYEGLCADPTATLSSVYQFLGLAPSTGFEDFRSAANHVVGNGMRLDSSSEIRLDERWRDVLNDVDLKQFDEIAGQLNRSFGYE